MRAARLIEPGRMIVMNVPKPVAGPGDLLVRVEACGICGSDRHMFRGEYPTAWPVTLGHEFSGILEAVGPGVTGFAPGDRITGDPNIACGACTFCREGRPNLCENLSAIGVQRDGGFAEYVVVPAGQAAKLPATLNPLHGAFTEPVSCCLHAIDVARTPRGGSVLILGGGVIGLLMVQLARLAGAGTVALATRQAPRRQLALELGATHAVDPAAGDAAFPGALTGGSDVVIECAGVPETFQPQSVGPRNSAKSSWSAPSRDRPPDRLFHVNPRMAPGAPDGKFIARSRTMAGRTARIFASSFVYPRPRPMNRRSLAPL